MEDVRRLAEGENGSEIAVSLDDLAREGARRMIATALEAEVGEYVERFADDRGEAHCGAKCTTSAGAGLRVPVNDARPQTLAI
jgi:hypothetical protein